MTDREPSPEDRYALDWPEPSRTHGNPAGQPPAQVRWRWNDGSDQAEPPSTSPGTGHAECRQEIERLEALVAELRREVATLRRRAQLRAR